MKIDGLLRRVCALIVRACDPQAIILFGSYATGQDNVDSDVDILVIGDFRGSPFLRAQELRELFHGIPLRIDLHVATPEEVAAQSRGSLGFMSTVLASGVALYSKGGTGASPWLDERRIG